MLQQTPLIECHRQDGAKLVDFSGWEMPIHYGSQVEEHHQVRNHAGLFDVSHMTLVDVSGPDQAVYLKRLLANDCLLYTSPSPRDATLSRMPSSA